MNEVRHIVSVGNTDVITRYLREANEYVDLTGYTVKLKLTRNGATLFDKACTVHADQVTYKGRVDFTPIGADFSTIGIYRAVFTAVGPETLTFPRGNRQRFYIWVQ